MKTNKRTIAFDLFNTHVSRSTRQELILLAHQDAGLTLFTARQYYYDWSSEYKRINKINGRFSPNSTYKDRTQSKEDKMMLAMNLLQNWPMSKLVDLYNNETHNKVSRFSTKQDGLKRIKRDITPQQLIGLLGV